MTETNAPITRSTALRDERTIPSTQSGVRSSWLGNRRVGQKLALSAAAFSLPIGVLLSVYLTNQQQDIRVVQQELTGYTFMAPLGKLLRNVQADRRTATLVLQGDQAALSKQEEERQAIDAAFAALSNANANRDRALNDFSPQIKGIQDQWKQLVSQIDAETISSDAAPKVFNDLIAKKIQPLFLDIANDSGLTLDPELTSYQVMDLVTNKLPLGLPVAGGVRSLGLNAIRDAAKTGGVPTEGRRVEYQLKFQAARDAQETINRALNYAINSGPQVKAALSGPAQVMNARMNQVIDTFEQQIVKPEKITLSAAAYTPLLDPSFKAQYALYDAAVVTLGQLLEERQTRLQNQRLLGLLLALLAVLAAGALLYFITRNITSSLSRLEGASQRLATGDLNTEVAVNSRDEIGTVSQAFNGAVTQLRENEQKNIAAREEASKLQDNIGSFLDVTMNIADGDLTQRGKVSDDVLGNVVDSINVMVEELGGVLKGVRTASSSVSQASSDMLGTTDQIVRGADVAATETRRVAAQVQGVIAGIRDMNTAAQQSAEVARQSLAASEQGREAVLGTLGGMQNIRREVQGVARRIKTLGERSLEIQEIVDTISRLSSQTNLLALNASIEAAGAGTAGTRFAIVADEVRKLADSSAEATRRIASLIRTVQLEISEVVTSVEDGTREVEQGYKVASTAGERLGELGRLAAEAAQFAQAISAASGQQVSSIEEMGSAVSQIGEIAEQSRLSVQQGRAAAERLLPLARQLDDSLARFQLPV